LERIKSDFTLRGLVAELAGRGLKVDYRSVWEFVHAEKLSFKKNRSGWRARPSDVARRRAQWAKYQDRIEPERLVFIDEPGPRPTCPVARLGAARPASDRQGPAMVTGRLRSWRHCATTGSRRPWLLDSPIDGETFRTYVEEVLIPRFDPAISSSWTISAAIRAPRAPAHSLSRRQAVLSAEVLSDLNPIEQVFAKLKICCARLPPAPSKPSVPLSGEFSAASHQPSAQTTSKILDMPQLKIIKL